MAHFKMIILCSLLFYCATAAGLNWTDFSPKVLKTLEDEARSMFYHGWNNYLDNAFPHDELRPLTCEGLSKDEKDPTNIGVNDVLGGYSVTLIDSLDMFPILGDQKGFEKNVDRVRKYVDFNISSTVQVFETTIRGIGGLLSAHLYASTPRLGHQIKGYDGILLQLAYDLGERLLPSFDSPSGIPYPRINLKYGLKGAKITQPDDPNDVTETCTSGAGSLVLEFALLSRLTGDDRFENVAKRAFFALWARRSDLDLVAMAIDSETGNWLSPMTGNGASIDSYYEYAIKYYVLFGSRDFLSVFNRAHRALLSHSFDGWMFHNVNFEKGNAVTSWVDSLAAFYPSVMVLGGDIENAIRAHMTYYKIWNTYSAVPERWYAIPSAYASRFVAESSVNLEWYPLRPEFIESNYYIYQATKDPLFIQIGKSAMEDIQKRNKVKCGYAGTQDVKTGALSNRMESFFLSETTKYLYLLFNQSHPLNNEFSNFVFSTEAHPFWFDKDILEHAGARNFEIMQPVWEKAAASIEDEDDIEEDEEENDELDFEDIGDYDPDSRFYQIGHDEITEEHAKLLREMLDDESTPWYKKLTISMLWGDYRSITEKRRRRSLLGRMIRHVIFRLKDINRRVDSYFVPQLVDYIAKKQEAIKQEKQANQQSVDLPTQKAIKSTPHAYTQKSAKRHHTARHQHQYQHHFNQTTPHAVECSEPSLAPFFFHDQCEVWRPYEMFYASFPETLKSMKSHLDTGLYSKVASNPEFYQLDNLYMYKRPRYLRKYQSFEDRNDFRDRYIVPDGVCQLPTTSLGPPAPLSNEMDIMFLLRQGTRKGTVVLRYGNGTIEATNLNGIRIKIKQRNQDDEPLSEVKVEPLVEELEDIGAYEEDEEEEWDEEENEWDEDDDEWDEEDDEEEDDEYEDYDEEDEGIEGIRETPPGPLYDVVVVDGVKVPAKLRLRDLWLSSGVIELTGEGRVRIQNYTIDNIEVLNIYS